jgi:hypothetical protein
MTTTSLIASPSATRRPSMSPVIAAALFLAAITVLIVLWVGRATGTTDDGTSGTTGGGQDTSQCYPTAVLHYC